MPPRAPHTRLSSSSLRPTSNALEPPGPSVQKGKTALIVRSAFGAAMFISMSPSLYAQTTATTVYNLPTAANFQYPSLRIAADTEYGSAIHLGGTNRDIQSATVSVYSNIARTADVTLSLYAALPEDRYPATGSTSPVANLKPADTALWTSGPILTTFTGGGTSNTALNQLLFSGINTLVPDNFFWVISFDNITNLTNTSTFGPKLGNAASISPTGAATDPGRIYLRQPDLYDGAWVPATIAANNAGLGITLTAVPEPSTVFIVLGSVIGLAGWRRRS